MVRGPALSRCGVLVFAALLALARASGAQTRVDEPVDHATRGEVTVVDPVAKTFTVRGEDGQLTTLAVDAETTLLEGSAHIGLDQLAKGDRVAVEWDDRTGRNLAAYLEVVDAAAPEVGARDVDPTRRGR